MRKSLRGAVLGALLVLAVAPSVASAAFTPRIANVATVEAGCYPKAPLPLPVAGGGVLNGARDYRIEAVVGGIEQAPCAVLNTNVPVNYGTLLQWQATPGATEYRVFRGTNRIATLPADNTTCAAANAGERCTFFDTGAIPGVADTPKPVPPEQTQAGSHPDLNITQLFDYGGANTTDNSDDPAPDGTANSASLRTNIIHFPAGLVANPTATTAKCSLTQLIGAPATNSGGAGTSDTGEDSCPRASQVGTVTALIQSAPVAPANPPTPAVGDIYVGETLGNETARLYVALRPPCSEGYPAPLNPGGAACTARLGGATREVEKSFLSAIATIRGNDYGIDNETVSVAKGVDEELAPVSNVRSTTTGALLAPVPIQVRALSQNLFGSADQGTGDAADNKSFVTMPTSCLPKTMTADASSYLDPTNVSHAAPTPLQATNCPGVPFSPNLGAVVDASGDQAGQNDHPGFIATVTQNADEAATKTATVTLPEGIGTDPNALARVCTLAQQPNSCPDSSRVGTAKATTPVLPGTLTGPVYIAETGVGLPKLIVVLQGAATIRLEGAISFDSTNTRLVNTFDNLPEVTLSSFELAIAGGSGGLLQNTRSLCDGALGNADATFAGYNGATVTRSPAVSVVGLDYYCVPPPPPGCKVKKPKQSLSVKGIKKNKAILKSKITRGNGCKKSNIRKTTMKAPKGMKFAKKKKIVVKANGKKITSFKAKGRKLTINTKKGTKKVQITTKKGAIKVSKKLRKKGKKQKLKFQTKVKVQNGKTFTIKKSVKPKS
jgi:hypothetical protein